MPDHAKSTPRPAVTPAMVRELMAIAVTPLSLEALVGPDDGSELGELIEDRAAPAPFEVVCAQLLREQLEMTLGSLEPRERRVLDLRFGLADGRARTLDEVGRDFGLTRERIRQIEARALRKLRHPSRADGLREFLR